MKSRTAAEKENDTHRLINLFSNMPKDMKILGAALAPSGIYVAQLTSGEWFFNSPCNDNEDRVHYSDPYEAFRAALQYTINNYYKLNVPEITLAKASVLMKKPKKMKARKKKAS